VVRKGVWFPYDIQHGLPGDAGAEVFGLLAQVPTQHHARIPHLRMRGGDETAAEVC
jgi:hypothetical protein